MKSSRIVFVCLLSIIAIPAIAQKLKKADRLTLENIKQHIGYLADDRLEGRRAGTPGEKLAMEYISSRMQELGLAPKGTKGYYQPFEINEGRIPDPGAYLYINNDKLNPEDYFFLAYSAEKKVEASPAIALQESGMPWFTDLKEVLQENEGNPHFDLQSHIKTTTQQAYEKGATALILYNSSNKEDQLKFDGNDRSAALPIPIIYVKKKAAEKYLSDVTASIPFRIQVKFTEKKRTANNVIGYLDNAANNTIILGAHFDHLGYGEDGNSMLRTGDKLIHNGADDNASGTAALLELARLLKDSKAKNNNYLFIAFSAEELGLYGSKYFTENPSINLSSANYMINMDMVGRLSDSTQTLAIGGYGTSPAWARVIDPEQRKLAFKIKLDSSGTGPSDHTSFYRKDIPVLFFFTGQHKDYHRPSDDAPAINYEGEVHIINYIAQLIQKLDKEETKLAFLKTKEEAARATSFKVTLGVMPDYTFSGTGMRIDGVTEGRPGAKAGLKAGDIILKIGDYEVNSVQTYMQTLGKFEKGQKTKIRFKRGNELVESDLEW